MNENSEKFYIVGHRGAAGERFENSLDGFRHALGLEIDGVEIDVRDHSGEIWVIHDDDLGRLTGTSGRFIEHPDVAQLTLRNGEPVPRLRQVLDLYWGKMPVNIEIKALADPEGLLALLAGYPALPPSDGLPWILISSFNHRALTRLRALGCAWPLAPISLGVPLEIDATLAELAPWSWHFDDEYLDLDLVARLRERGVASLVFTVNDPARAQALAAGGVAGIFTDLPTQMLDIV